MDQQIKNDIDAIWLKFFSGGVTNPISVIEQMTYLLFMRGLDDSQSRKEKQAKVLGREIEDPIFPSGSYTVKVSGQKVPYEDLRWSRFKNLGPADMYDRVAYQVFPFIKTLGDDKSPFAKHMADAVFLIPPDKASLLASVIDSMDKIPLEGTDTKGDLYEHLLGKLSQAGDAGQFRTPRHIIKLMVDMMEPNVKDTICDPACGTAGFLVGVAEYFNREKNRKLFSDHDFLEHYHTGMLNGYDFDATMLRIACMNLLLHGVRDPGILNRDALAEDHAGEEEKYSLILANPPFAGALGFETTSKNLLQVVKTKKTELLFMALFLRLLKPGGRAAVIVPDGVLFGSSKAHKDLRKVLVEDQKLDGVVSMPSGVFKPYAGVSTAILFFTKTNSGGTENVWFYDMKSDGYSLDDHRRKLNESDLEDILKRWQSRDKEGDRARTDQSFLVPKDEIASNDYDLSINRYKEVVYEEVQYDPPKEIVQNLKNLEKEIDQGLKDLEGMLG